MTDDIDKPLFWGTKRHSKTIIKVCARCNRKYYPRNNGYELISRYCSADCYKKRAVPYKAK